MSLSTNHTSMRSDDPSKDPTTIDEYDPDKTQFRKEHTTQDDPMQVIYTVSPTCKRFHLSDSFVRALMGPIGSGKSVACCWEVMLKGLDQNPFFGNPKFPLGIRKSRWVIIRNTYRELIDTTMQTWFDWFPQHSEPGWDCEWEAGNMKHIIKLKLEDGTHTHLEVLFRALDRPDDIKKLLSLELTGGWINEAREMPKQVMDMLIGRLGRYPNMRQGGASWFGLIMDTNPPDSDHWWHTLFEETHPEGYELFRQPSGTSQQAENMPNLPSGYYEKMRAGKDPNWVNVYIHGEYGFLTDGIPVVPEFHMHQHVAKQKIPYLPKKSDNILYVGVDFGRTPAATFAQEINGQMQVIDELVTFGISATHFSKLLKERLRGFYPKAEVVATGDPAGDNPGEQIDETCIEILQNAGIPIDPAHSNNFTLRRESVSISLTTLNMQGEPTLIISPSCTNLIKGMNGGYKYKRMQVSGEKFAMKPDKNKYSHVCEALQYLMMGAGKGYDAISSHSDVSKYKVKGALG